MTYRGPRGVEDALQHALGADLHRESGIKLGPLSTKFVASIVDDDELPFHDLTRVGIVVFDVGARNGRTPRPLTAADLGFGGWTTLVDARDDGGQALILVKQAQGAIHDMMLVAADDDEVVVARLSGRLDRIIASAIEGAKESGAGGVRRAVPISSD
jgi:hypothetical protein